MRTLGSFNRRVNLQSHPEDHEAPSMPQIARLLTRSIPDDVNNPSNARKFATGQGRPGREQVSRFAGAALNVDLRKNEQMPNQDVTFSTGLPLVNVSSPVGAAELRVFSS